MKLRNLILASCLVVVPAYADNYDEVRGNLRDVQSAIGTLAIQGKDAALVVAIQQALTKVSAQIAALKPTPSPSPEESHESK